MVTFAHEHKTSVLSERGDSVSKLYALMEKKLPASVNFGTGYAVRKAQLAMHVLSGCGAGKKALLYVRCQPQNK